MNYTLHQLQVFLKICETQSITKASEALHLTQPAVSIQLKNFQNQFDIPLTEVIGRQIYITDFGHEIAKAAEIILNEVEKINFKTHNFKGKLSGKLKISVVSTGKYVIPYFLSEFMKLHPEVELSLDVTNKALVIDSLSKNEVDFALVSILPEQLPIAYTQLMENRLYLVGNGQLISPANSKKNKWLENIPFIYRETGSGTRITMEKYLSKNQIPFQTKLTLTSNEAVKQAIIAGLGFSIMPIIGIKNELQNKELQIFPMNNLPITTNWNFIWHKEKKFSPVASAYLDYLNENKAHIIEKHFSWMNKY